MKTLIAAGRVQNKRERRGEAIVVKIKLMGEPAKRFDSLRGNQCPKEFAAELLSSAMEKLERAHLEPQRSGF